MSNTSIPKPRVAIVQHGDYAAAYQIFRNDLPEPYAGMKKSVEATEQLLTEKQFLLISLDGDSYRTLHRHGLLAGLPPRRLPRFIPKRLAAAWQRSQVLTDIQRFAPTHLLIRTSGQLVTDLLTYGARHNTQCLVVFANVFDTQTARHASTQKLVGLLNQPFVNRVANHLQPAVDSMIECGVAPGKAVAYDFDLPQPVDRLEPKRLDTSGRCELVFAGNLVHAKGCHDVVLATAELHSRNIPVHLSVYGDGPVRKNLEQLCNQLPRDVVQFYGRQPNSVVASAMRESSFVCVPSHREFPEGMPMTLTEALKSRSPVIASDHPVFIRAFQDGEGIRFVPEKQPKRIADAIEQLWQNPEVYHAISEKTASALDRVKCTNTLTALLKEWSEGIEKSYAPETQWPNENHRIRTVETAVS